MSLPIVAGGAGLRLERAFRRALTLALLLHMPLVPSPMLDWARWLFPHTSDYDDADAQAIVPIDLDLLAREPAAELPHPPPVPPAPEVSVAEPDGGAPRPRSPRASPVPDDGGVLDAGLSASSPVQEPLATAGGAGKIAAKDPNVQLLLSGVVLRKHAMGAWLRRLLQMIPEWQSFFQTSPIDPIEHLDHLLITAPRLRGDASKMVAIMDFNAPAAVVREAVDQIIHRENGVWIEDSPVTAARARVGGTHRIFALMPQKRLLAVLPGDAMNELGRLKQAKPFKRAAEGLVVSLLTPARPLREMFPLPDSLKWMRLALIPTSDGGVDLAIEAGDQSAEQAVQHADAMTAEMERRRKIEVLGLATLEILDPVTFEAKDELIRARTHVSRAKLTRILTFIEQQTEAAFQAHAPPVHGRSPP